MICLLGNFRLLVAGELSSTRAGGKSEALLSLLALSFGRRVPREQILQSLWPESDPALARNSLHNLVHHLNRLLGPVLHGAPPVLNDDGYYRLNTEAGIGVDVAYFDRLVAVGDQQIQAGDTATVFCAYDRAAELYRGDLQFASDAQAVMERERLRARYLTLLAQLAEQSYHRSDYSAAQAYLWRLLARDPYREDAHRLMMRCYVRRGERAAALHQYQVCVDLLRDEFDVAPESTTIALFDQIRADPDGI
jgi:DNA-binding SARP family transcriptional activator